MCLTFTRSSIMLTFLLFFFLFVPLSHPWDASQKTHLLGIPLGSSLLRRARKPLAQWFLQLSMWWERELVVWRTGHTLSPALLLPTCPLWGLERWVKERTRKSLVLIYLLKNKNKRNSPHPFLLPFWNISGYSVVSLVCLHLEKVINLVI